MKHALWTTLFAALLLFGCTACARPFTEKENGQTINLAVDDPFEIELPGNPTTGYQWEIADFDASVVKSAGEPEFKADSKAIGSGGMHTFRFQTVADGQTTIKLIYHRSFEKDTPPIKTYELTVVVGTMGQILEP